MARAMPLGAAPTTAISKKHIVIFSAAQVLIHCTEAAGGTSGAARYIVAEESFVTPMSPSKEPE
jgi:hypothetical protein